MQLQAQGKANRPGPTPANRDRLKMQPMQKLTDSIAKKVFQRK